MPDRTVLEHPEAVAVVGLAGRFPGARDADELWRRLEVGERCISDFDDRTLLEAGIDPARLADSRYVRSAGVLADIDRFDATLFGFSPREAEVTDPQIRILLECAWEALEDAGCDPEDLEGAVGVFAGSGLNRYVLDHLLGNPEVAGGIGWFRAQLGNDKDYLASWLSYKLDLRGPTVAVQTACSTSLVAIHLACQSLLEGSCDAALAGGVTVSHLHPEGYRWEQGGILSPDGHCRAFDREAAGTVSGDGVGMVVLKRLEAARADGDRVRAVIRGSAINNDGSTKVGFTAPSVSGQTKVIAEALGVAEVDPRTVGFIEAHGTGTPLGDPIEIEALTTAFREFTSESGFCAVGSVKSNLGHLDAAAGVAGLIKAVLALERGRIPPSVDFREPNPAIDFAASPFFVNTEALDWPSPGTPHRAGVSSFGMGGTNAHVVLEEAPEALGSGPSRAWQVLVLSGARESTAEGLAERLAERLEGPSPPDLADAAFTLQTGRRRLPCRRALVAASPDEAVRKLRSGELHAASEGLRNRPVAFLFPGQGAQHPGMARAIYDEEALFREELDRCADLLRPDLGLDLREAILADGVSAREADPLARTALTQPALFAVEYALARHWQSWGVEPRGLLGHSVGEYVAACLAGVFPLEAALALVAERGRLMEAQPPGAMAALPLGEEEVRAILERHAELGLDLAAVNEPGRCVVSGPAEGVEALEDRLGGDGLEVRRLRVSHAFHSRAMDPVIEPLARRVAALGAEPPRVPFVSSVTGGWIRPEEATDPKYWGRQARATVRFSEGVSTLAEDPSLVLLEVGPGRTLSSLARRHPAVSDEQVVLWSLPHRHAPDSSSGSIHEAVARLWTAGVPIDWRGYHGDGRRTRVSLPVYPFERQRHWMEQPARSARRGRIRGASFDEWFYLPTWRRARPLAAEGPRRDRPSWVLFQADDSVGAAVAEGLRAEGARVVEVRAGDAFRAEDDGSFVIRRREPSDYVRLWREVREDAAGVAHLWSLAGESDSGGVAERFDPAQERGLYSLLCLSQALRSSRQGGMQVVVVTDRARDVTGDEDLRPEQASLLGACRVVPQELPHLVCRNVDVAASRRPADDARVAAQLVRELLAMDEETDVAYRGDYRWIAGFEPVALPETDQPTLPEGGVFLVLGGLGRMGRILLGGLASAGNATIVVTGRSELPPRESWKSLAGSEELSAGTREKLGCLLEVERSGAATEVEVLDVSDRRAVEELIDAIHVRHGRLDGVIFAAGAADDADAPVSGLQADGCEPHLAVKARGLIHLAAALADRPQPGFVLVMSSLASVLGGLSFFSYAAANAFADAFVRSCVRQGAGRWVAIDWDGWRFGDGGAGEPGSADAPRGVTPQAGLEATERILAAESLSHVVVSTHDLELRLDRWVRRSWREKDGGLEPGSEAGRSGAGAERPAVGEAEPGPVQAEVSRIWRAILGVEEIGAGDDFFELGGDSLGAIRVSSRLRESFGVEVPVVQLFETPTLATLSTEVGRLIGSAPEGDREIQGILRELEGASTEDLHELVDELESMTEGDGSANSSGLNVSADHSSWPEG